MAHKRKRKTRSRGMSESVKARVRRTRTRTRRRSRGGLSEAFSKHKVTETAKVMAKGALIGFGVRKFKPLIDEMPEWAKHVVPLGLSFVAGAVLNMEGVSNSIATIWGYELANELDGMHDNYDYANPNALNDNVEYMDENGHPLVLADDGNLYYLNEDEMMNDDFMDDDFMDEDYDLSANTFLADGEGLPYPAYANVDRR